MAVVGQGEWLSVCRSGGTVSVNAVVRPTPDLVSCCVVLCLHVSALLAVAVPPPVNNIDALGLPTPDSVPCCVVPTCLLLWLRARLSGA
jgi:hypothetical protein